MPKRKRHIQLFVALLGVGIISATGAYADQPGGQRAGELQAQHDSRIHNTDITGGFYDDHSNPDDWYYDFYDSQDIPGLIPIPSPRCPTTAR
ncbi:MAG TPA: hypothetical protein PKW52_09680 [Nitrospira sp.]|nr:hypothetical protein [Nitrospira sp.]HQV11599.1 hypothetical protein [Nitrospira sp.]